MVDPKAYNPKGIILKLHEHLHLAENARGKRTERGGYNWDMEVGYQISAAQGMLWALAKHYDIELPDLI